MEGNPSSSHHNSSSGPGGLLDVNQNAFKPKRTISYKDKQASGAGKVESNKTPTANQAQDSSCLKCSLL